MSEALIRAAGGIVKGTGRNQGKIAIVHRARYEGEIGLPKGKVDLSKGEDEERTAVREVEEETGIKAILRDIAGGTRYLVGGRPKRVLYFFMDAPDDKDTKPKDPKEIASVEWVTPVEAAGLLTHPEDRELIQRIFPDQSSTRTGTTSMLRRWFVSAPERERLGAAIKDAAITHSQASAARRLEWWWLSANKYLKEARTYLADLNLQQGWSALASANRLMVLDGDYPKGPQLAATELLRESEKKLSGWRAEAVRDLICDDKGKRLRTDLDKESVVYALKIRDDQFETDYFKIILRRWHLQIIIGLLGICVAGAVYLLSKPWNDLRLTIAVLLFGAIGAALSVAIGLMKLDLSAKIPAQKLGAFVIWARPIIGAAAALISFVLLRANVIHILNLDFTNPWVILTVATVAGFSERFIVGAIEKIGAGNNSGSGK